MRFLLVGVGGAIGSMLRYWIALLFADSDFPRATLAVNVVGCLLIGFLLTFAPDRWPPTLVTAGAVGLIGGFTTFSTFAWETLTMAQAGDLMRSGVYVAASLVIGLVAVIAGVAIGRSLT